MLYFLSVVCFNGNLWAHLRCWFYRMASVQYKQRSLWKVSIYSQMSVEIVQNIWETHFFSFPFLLPGAAGSAVSVKSAPDSVTPSSVSNMGTLTDSVSGPASLLTSNQASLGALGHGEDLPPSTIPPQHNKYDGTNSTDLWFVWVYVHDSYLVVILLCLVTVLWTFPSFLQRSFITTEQSCSIFSPNIKLRLTGELFGDLFKKHIIRLKHYVTHLCCSQCCSPSLWAFSSLYFLLCQTRR